MINIMKIFVTYVKISMHLGTEFKASVFESTMVSVHRIVWETGWVDDLWGQALTTGVRIGQYLTGGHYWLEDLTQKWCPVFRIFYTCRLTLPNFVDNM